MLTSEIERTARMLQMRVGRNRPWLDVVERLRTGLPPKTIQIVADALKRSPSDVGEAIGVHPRTLARRVGENRALSGEESQAVFRAARVVTRATEVFESRAKARRWLFRPNAALGGEAPFRVLDTDIGAETVLDELGRIEHGIFA